MGRRREGRDRGQDMVAKEQKMQGIGGEFKWDTPHRVDVKELGSFPHSGYITRASDR